MGALVLRRAEALETMAKATRDRGFEYFGVADHSKSAHYAGGLSVEQIEEQHHEADRLNKRFGKDFRILKGIESGILADGSLDYPDDVLESFDFVVASIHGCAPCRSPGKTEDVLDEPLIGFEEYLVDADAEHSAAHFPDCHVQCHRGVVQRCNLRRGRRRRAARYRYRRRSATGAANIIADNATKHSTCRYRSRCAGPPNQPFDERSRAVV
jgi:histidinol phosphatase-like PHP family hydrolase